MTLTSMLVFVHEKSNISNVSQSKNTLCVKSNHLKEDRQRDVIVKDRNKQVRKCFDETMASEELGKLRDRAEDVERAL